MSVTITDVAARAGVSIKTVSRVLNREPNVRTGTRDRVLEAAEALDYRPNISARSLAGARSYLIALFFDNPSAGYVTELELGAIGRCREAGFHLTIEPIDSSAADLGQILRPLISTLRVDGVILTSPVCDNAIVLDMLDETGTAYVRIAPNRDAERAPHVDMDDVQAAYEMTSYLIGLGHRDIGFIKGHPEHSAAHNRLEGFEKACRDNGLHVRPDRVLQGYFSFRSGFECAEALLGGEDRPTAIFASNDDMALGVMAVAHRRGLTVPQDLAICGFDDTPAAAAVWPQLTTVRQPIREMGAAAADLIISGEAKAERLNSQGLSRLLEFQLVLRESTAPPARA